MWGQLKGAAQGKAPPWSRHLPPRYSKSLLNGSTQKLTSRPRVRVRDSPILSSRMPRPRAHVCSSAGPPPAPSSVRASPASYSAPMSERLQVPTTWASALSLSGSSESARAGRLSRHDGGVVSPWPWAGTDDHQTDHSPTLRSNTPPEWVVWCSCWCVLRCPSWVTACSIRSLLATA